jgi:large subunit ribosomal protein L31e
MAKETKKKQKPKDEEIEDIAAELEEEEKPEAAPEQAEAKEEAPEKAEEEAPQEGKEAAEEEEEAEAKPKKKKEEEIVEERFYTIPLQRANIRPPKKRAPRAMQLIRLFVAKHMKLQTKIDEEDEEAELPKLIIAEALNEQVWARGIEKPPRKIKVRVTKDEDGNLTVYPVENQ